MTEEEQLFDGKEEVEYSDDPSKESMDGQLTRQISEQDDLQTPLKVRVASTVLFVTYLTWVIWMIIGTPPVVLTALACLTGLGFTGILVFLTHLKL